MTHARWPEVGLGEVAFYQEGPGLRKWQWTSNGMKVINGTNVLQSGEFVPDNTARFVSDDEFRTKYQHFAIDDGDIVVVSSGNTIGKVARVRAEHLPMMMNTSVIRFHPHDSSVLDHDFLFAYFRTASFREQMFSMATGTAQPNFGPSHLSRMKIALPPIREQRKLGLVARVLDDLIENNRRRIGLLEQMAQAIYREWFVKFRYPGHEHATFVDSPLGPIPSDWSCLTVGHIAKVNVKSRTPKADERVRYLDISTLGERQVTLPGEIDGSDAPGRARRCVSPGDVVWSMVRPVRRAHALLVAPASDWIASTGLAVLTPSKVSAALLFETVSSQEYSDYLVSQEGGSAYPAVKPTDFEKAPMLVPSIEIDNAFDRLVRPIHELTWSLARQSDELTQLRDLLLPKLVTGQIDVSSLDLDALLEGMA
jgi:type I restriction enzyme, S subunit